MKLLMFLLGLIPIASFGYTNITCPKLTPNQLDVLQYAYHYGKPYDLQYTLATIALKESSAGRYLINYSSNDYGVFQGNYKTLCIQAGVFDNKYKCSIELSNVVTHIDVAASHAVATLLEWRNYYHKSPHSHVYQLMVRSYHSGFSPMSKEGDRYWKRFKKDMDTIKYCVQFN